MQEAMQVEHYFLAGTDLLNWKFTQKKVWRHCLRADNCKQRGSGKKPMRNGTKP
jgi:hypothetical protein